MSIIMFPRKPKKKDYECLVCFRDIKKKQGVCDSCAEKFFESGRIYCERCDTLHSLDEGETILDIHNKAKTFLFKGDDLRGRLFFFGACKDCDPQQQFNKVTVQHIKLQ